MAAAISCMRALPAGRDTIHFAEMAPYPMAMSAQTSAKTICCMAYSPFLLTAYLLTHLQAGRPARKSRILAGNHEVSHYLRASKALPFISSTAPTPEIRRYFGARGSPLVAHLL